MGVWQWIGWGLLIWTVLSFACALALGAVLRRVSEREQLSAEELYRRNEPRGVRPSTHSGRIGAGSEDAEPAPAAAEGSHIVDRTASR